MSNGHAPASRPTFYAVAVRGIRGRKWFHADSAQCGDLGFVQDNVDELNRRFAGHGVRFAAMDTKTITGGIAPAHYRPWDTDEDEGGDVDMDALADDEL